MLLPLKDTPFYRDLQSTFDKISEKLAKTSRNYLDELQSEVIFEPGPRWGLGIDPDVVDVLRSACGERQQVEFSYAGVTRQQQKIRPPKEETPQEGADES
jgi:predicted DNA-binding transcriptional regulator YafY